MGCMPATPVGENVNPGDPERKVYTRDPDLLSSKQPCGTAGSSIRYVNVAYLAAANSAHWAWSSGCSQTQSGSTQVVATGGVEGAGGEAGREEGGEARVGAKGGGEDWEVRAASRVKAAAE